MQEHQWELGKIVVEGRDRIVMAVFPGAFSGADPWMEVVEGMDEDFILVNRDKLNAQLGALEDSAMVMAVTMATLQEATRFVWDWIKSRSG